MSFTDLLQPLTADSPTGTGHGRGLTIPILKAMNHTSLILTYDDQGAANPEYIDAEVNEILNHLHPDNIIRPPFPSARLNAKLDSLELARLELNNYASWGEDQLTSNLNRLLSALFGLCHTIDWELAGIADGTVGSNP